MREVSSGNLSCKKEGRGEGKGRCVCSAAQKMLQLLDLQPGRFWLCLDKSRASLAVRTEL